MGSQTGNTGEPVSYHDSSHIEAQRYGGKKHEKLIASLSIVHLFNIRAEMPHRQVTPKGEIGPCTWSVMNPGGLTKLGELWSEGDGMEVNSANWLSMGTPTAIYVVCFPAADN